MTRPATNTRRPIRRRAALALAALGTSLLAATCRRHPGSRELTIAVRSEIASLDPHLSTAIAALEHLSNVYEPLVALDSEMVARPALASSWESPDAVTWVFHLRPSVRFHHGQPFTGRDVVHSFERLLRDERLRIRSQVASVAQVTAPRDDTVVVRTRWPNAQLLGSLSFVAIVPRGSTSASLERRPDGTGPYTVEAWKPRVSLRLHRNESYWGPKPDVEKAAISFGITDSLLLARIGGGPYDFFHDASPEVEAAATRSGRFEILRRPNFFLRYLGFDVAHETTAACPGIPNPFRRPEVREAIDLALDRPSLAARVAPGAVPASQLVPRSIYGYDPARGPGPHDLERARRLLTGAGMAGGFEVVLHGPRGFERAAGEVRDQLSRIGIRVRVVSLPSVEFFGALSRRELGFWIAAHGCATGSVAELLEGSFHTPDSAHGLGGRNYTGFSSEEFDRAIEEAGAQSQPSIRLLDLQRLAGRILDGRAWIPLYYDEDVFVVERSFAYRPRADLMLRVADFARTR